MSLDQLPFRAGFLRRAHRPKGATELWKADPQVPAQLWGKGQGVLCAPSGGLEATTAPVHQAAPFTADPFCLVVFFSLFLVCRNHITKCGLVGSAFEKVPFAELAANIKVKWFEGYSRKEEIRVQALVVWLHFGLLLALGRDSLSKNRLQG